MELLFDSLGTASRHPDVSEALATLASEEGADRGAIFTRPEVAISILDLVGYTSDRPLYSMRFLEPSFGAGDFLLPALDRLLTSFFDAGHTPNQALEVLKPALRGVELHIGSVSLVRKLVMDRLTAVGLHESDASALCDCWLISDDFLLCALPESFDVVVGNPPYVRQERIPDVLLIEYRRRYRTLFDRADLYVPFYERALDLLAPTGRLGFICANRWTKNRYGGPLRAKVHEGFHLQYYVDMEKFDAFHSEVIAYPAITVIRRTQEKDSRVTRIATSAGVARGGLRNVAADLQNPVAAGIENVVLDGDKDAPWLLDDMPRLRLIRRLESRFPTIEDTGCKVGIGVATGCDKVFIGDFDTLPVEPERKLPLVMAKDLVDGRIEWGGKGVVNPFEEDGTLAQMEQWPLFADYLETNRQAVAGRHVAIRNPVGWYRTIDRITPSLVAQPKLLVPDIKGQAAFVLDHGNYYPHHNLYFITSNSWDLRALRTVLRSSLSVMIVATYCTKMAGGFLRFQAQYLRRLRLPRWETLDQTQRDSLLSVSDSEDVSTLDKPVFELFGLSEAEAAMVARIARESQIIPKKPKDSE
jgi:hypothetical protein